MQGYFVAAYNACLRENIYVLQIDRAGVCEVQMNHIALSENGGSAVETPPTAMEPSAVSRHLCIILFFLFNIFLIYFKYNWLTVQKAKFLTQNLFEICI